jgi:hypothetical protein
MRSFHISVTFVTAILAGGATGCTTMRPIYPDSWPAQVAVDNDACPSIDGVYQNAGEWFAGEKYVADPPRQTVSLAYLLSAGPAYILYDGYIGAEDEVSPDYVNRLGKTYRDPTRDAYRTIALRLADDTLHVEATLADGGKREFALPVRERCRDSLLVVETGPSSEEELGAYYPFLIGSSTYALGRAADGSLLMYASSWDVMFWFVLPMLATNEASWVRFPAASSEPVQSSVSIP